MVERVTPQSEEEEEYEMDEVEVEQPEQPSPVKLESNKHTVDEF